MENLHFWYTDRSSFLLLVEFITLRKKKVTVWDKQTIKKHRWSLNTGYCLIEVVTKADLTTFIRIVEFQVDKL